MKRYIVLKCICEFIITSVKLMVVSYSISFLAISWEKKYYYQEKEFLSKTLDILKIKFSLHENIHKCCCNIKYIYECAEKINIWFSSNACISNLKQNSVWKIFYISYKYKLVYKIRITFIERWFKTETYLDVLREKLKSWLIHVVRTL